MEFSIMDLGQRGDHAREPMYNWIKIENGKLVDMAVGTGYAGCACSCKSDGGLERCSGFEDCFNSVYNALSVKDRQEVDRLLNR